MSGQIFGKKIHGNKEASVHHGGSLTLAPDHSLLLKRKSSCACGGGCPGCQAKSALNVSRPNDPAEIEADAIADRVMRMSESGGATTVGAASALAESGRILRKCSACEQDEDDRTIHLKSLPAGGADTTQNPDHVRNAIDGGGRELDVQTKSFFEPRLGYDLSAVRMHTSDAAAESARKLNARAYTLGRDIVFGAGEYQPESESGRHLLAHELAHTTQQASVGQTIHRSPAECPDPVPNGWQLYGGIESLAKDKLFLGSKPNPTVISGLRTKGIRDIPELDAALHKAQFWADTEHPSEATECAGGPGVRLSFPSGNSLSLNAVELCQEGDLVKFKFFCGDQSPEKKCSQMGTDELIASGQIDRVAVESKMREFLAAAASKIDQMEVIAVVLACDSEDHLFYYQVASSNPGQLSAGVADVAAKYGFEATYSMQTRRASDLVRSAEGKARLREVYGVQADSILTDLASRDTPTKEAAQLKIYEAFKEYPNLHAEREAIFAIKDKGDKPIFVMPSSPACDICAQFIPENDVILLSR